MHALLSIVDGSGLQVPPHIRTASAVLFKNFIRNRWADDLAAALGPDDRAAVKTAVIDRLTEVPAPVQLQLAEALVQIAAVDFPAGWPDMLQRLAGKLSAEDYEQNNAILRTLHYVFKRYRSESRTDELFSEINFVMGQFAPVLLGLFRSLAALVEQHAGSPERLGTLLQGQVLCNKIFYSLSMQDLPEFFEDHLAEFMGALKTQYVYTGSGLRAAGGADAEDDDEEGPVERLVATVAEIVNLYAMKYEEEFALLPDFVQLSWQVLTATVTAAPRFDRVAGTCMLFLATASRQERHRELFGPVLQLICDKVVLPNMRLRPADLELFEDEPLEFIRRDQEVTANAVVLEEATSRRGAVVLLTRGLMEFYEAETTAILGAYVRQHMAEYAGAPAARWQDKNVATQIFSAIAVKGSVAQLGATKVNPLLDIPDFFRTNLAADLQPGHDALHPVLRMDAIKFLHQFRGQLSKETLVGVFPQLMHHVASPQRVIHTYAAMAVERILAIRGPGGAMFTAADLQQVVEPLCTDLLRLIMSKRTAEKMSENDLLMKALMRVFLLAQTSLLVPIAPALAGMLAELLFAVAKNPSNPRFNHFMFEALMALVRFCGADPAVAAVLQGRVLPVFREILAADLADFFPYILQLYAGTVEFCPAPSLPPYAQELLQAVLQPPLWAMPGNVPALIRLLQACLRADPQLFGQQQAGLLPPLLGIFQTLLGSRTNELHAFALFNTMLQTVPAAALQPYLQQALVLLLTKLRALKVARISSSLLLTVCSMALAYGGSAVFQLFEAVQPKMLGSLMKTLLLPEAARLRDPSDRRAVVLGLGRLVVGCPELAGRLATEPEYAALWLGLLSTCLSLLANIQQAADAPEPPADEPQLYADGKDEELAAHGSSFARLQVLPALPRFPPAALAADPVRELATGLAALSKQAPLAELAAGLKAGQREVLQALLQQAGTSL